MLQELALPVVAIGAHHDDIELGCGATLAKIAGHDRRAIKTVVATHSAYTSVEGLHRSADLAATESAHAAQALGIEPAICLGWETGHVAWNMNTVSALEEVLREFRAKTVLVHHMNDTHQDHHAVSRIAIAASRRIANVLMYEPLPPSGRVSPPFHPQLYVDVSETLARKLEALRQHKSQVERYGEEWIRATEARAVFRGFEAGTVSAEAFEVVRLVLP